VTSLELGSKTVSSDLSRPAADANLQGAPTWTCSSSPVGSVLPLDTVPAHGEVPDVVQGNAARSGGAQSATRLGEAVGQRTCGTYAVLEEPSSQVARDITALLIGALFSIGVGLVTEGLRRRPPRPAG
jgi:hypothetical protein